MGSDTIIILPRPAHPLRNIMMSDPIIAQRVGHLPELGFVADVGAGRLG